MSFNICGGRIWSTDATNWGVGAGEAGAGEAGFGTVGGEFIID